MSRYLFCHIHRWQQPLKPLPRYDYFCCPQGSTEVACQNRQLAIDCIPAYVAPGRRRVGVGGAVVRIPCWRLHVPKIRDLWMVTTNLGFEVMKQRGLHTRIFMFIHFYHHHIIITITMMVTIVIYFYIASLIKYQKLRNYSVYTYLYMVIINIIIIIIIIIFIIIIIIIGTLHQNRPRRVPFSSWFCVQWYLMQKASWHLKLANLPWENIWKLTSDP